MTKKFLYKIKAWSKINNNKNTKKPVYEISHISAQQRTANQSSHWMKQSNAVKLNPSKNPSSSQVSQVLGVSVAGGIRPA